MIMNKEIVRRVKSITITLLLFVLLIGAFGVFVYADSEIDTYGNDTEWWSFRNTESNNAVTERPTPTNDQEAWGKWAVRFGNDYAKESPTPPIIINNKLYVGSGDKIYEVNKETGKILRESETMPGDVGYSMQSPVYADGKIFIAISQGRICAVNIDNLTVEWSTDNSEIIKGQTLSPISYKKIENKGYVYTGTWTTVGGNLICADTDDWDENKDYIDEKGNKIKRLTWCFNPMEDDAVGLAEYNADISDGANHTVAVGYYWTGAYVTEKYLAIGSDNGSEGGDEVNDTAFYTLNPITGEIIDKVYGIKGQVRSTVVYDNGYLFFTTKGGKIYKIKADEEGRLSDVSFIDMQEYGVLMTTATPVVYNGKIYLGVQGRGNQFSADGGHGFVVARNDATLNQNSFLYNIPVPGYPQAGALLSTYHEDEDFDGDTVPDGRVYLFFTYNAFPGGIFYTYDTPNQTNPVSLSVEESRIFVPTGDKQQLCISSIVVDREGNLYYKNDSCYLFCVESNPAGINDLQVYCDDNSIAFNRPFHTKIPEYSCTVPGTSNKVTIKLTLADGVTATVDGKNYVNDGVDVSLINEVTVIPIVSTKSGKSRYYTVTITKESSNANLVSLASNYANSPSYFRPITPEFTQDIFDYEFNWRATGEGGSSILPEKQMMNIYLKPENSKSTVLVLPGENTRSGGTGYYDANGYVRPSSVNSGNKYSMRFPIYSADVTKDSKATITVIAEDGVTTNTYNITFSRRIYVASVTLNNNSVSLHAGDTVSLNAVVNPLEATNPAIEWTSTNESVATVDDNGNVSYVGAGTAIIIASTEDGPYDECQVVATNHYLNEYPYVGATCTTAGHEAYWRCTECNKYFSDAEAEVEIDSPTVLPALEHNWGDWLEAEPSPCIGEGQRYRVCQNDATHIEYESTGISSHELNHVENKEPTCEEDGNIEYWKCSVCEKYFASEDALNEVSGASVIRLRTGHKWNEPKYEWLWDYSYCTASVCCLNNETHILTESVRPSKEELKPAACETDGATRYSCSFENELFEDQTIDVWDINASGHDYRVDVIQPTCENRGYTLHTCNICGKSFEDQYIDAIGHNFGEVWTKLNSTQHQRVCANDNSHVEKASHTWDAGKVTKAATCIETGVKTYTCTICKGTKTEPIAVKKHSITKTAAKAATCTAAGNIEYYKCTSCNKLFKDATGKTEIKTADTVVNATNNHNWGAATYTWSKDNKMVTAKRTCKNNKDHKQTETANTTSKISLKATCTAKGKTTYTATFKNTAFKTQTKVLENIPATGHKYGAWTKLNNNQHQRVCANDKSHVEKAAHKWDSGRVTKQPTTTVTGVKTYTCSVCKGTKTEPIAKLKETFRRVYGDDRYITALAIAETYMNETGQKKLNSIIVANAINFPDALAGSYLAKAKNAPIIIWHDSRNAMIQSFIKQKVKSGGTIYILGGTSAVGDNIKKNMGAYKFVRLADSNRYGTNIKILNAVGVKNEELLVCDATEAGKGINALIASATGKPILLVAKGGLLEPQKTWLSQNKAKITKITIIGNANSVDTKVESQLKAYGKVCRIGGKNGDEVSANVGKTYFKDAKEIFIATMDSYPDGLCGGPLAIAAKGPIILVKNSVNAASANYCKTLTYLQSTTVFGGKDAMPEATARKVAKNTKAKMTEFKK